MPRFDFLITKAPTATTCSRCSAPLLAATVGGLDVRVDPVALNDLGELAALMGGRRTYEVRGEWLILRRPEHIRAGNRGPVLGAHACTPVADDHIDHCALTQAAALVRSLLGTVPEDDPAAPPPF